MNKPNADEMIQSALRRYRRQCAREGALRTEPGDVTVCGDVVELSNVRGKLARYRLTGTGRDGRMLWTDA